MQAGRRNGSVLRTGRTSGRSTIRCRGSAHGERKSGPWQDGTDGTATCSVGPAFPGDDRDRVLPVTHIGFRALAGVQFAHQRTGDDEHRANDG